MTRLFLAALFFALIISDAMIVPAYAAESFVAEARHLCSAQIAAAEGKFQAKTPQIDETLQALSTLPSYKLREYLDPDDGEALGLVRQCGAVVRLEQLRDRTREKRIVDEICRAEIGALSASEPTLSSKGIESFVSISLMDISSATDEELSKALSEGVVPDDSPLGSLSRCIAQAEIEARKQK